MDLAKMPLTFKGMGGASSDMKYPKPVVKQAVEQALDSEEADPRICRHDRDPERFVANAPRATNAVRIRRYPREGMAESTASMAREKERYDCFLTSAAASILNCSHPWSDDIQQEFREVNGNPAARGRRTGGQSEAPGHQPVILESQGVSWPWAHKPDQASRTLLVDLSSARRYLDQSTEFPLASHVVRTWCKLPLAIQRRARGELLRPRPSGCSPRASMSLFCRLVPSRPESPGYQRDFVPPGGARIFDCGSRPAPGTSSPELLISRRHWTSSATKSF